MWYFEWFELDVYFLLILLYYYIMELMDGGFLEV